MKRQLNKEAITVTNGQLITGEGSGTFRSANLDRKHYMSGLFNVRMIGAVNTLAIDLTLEHSDNESNWFDVPEAIFSEAIATTSSSDAEYVYAVPLSQLKRYVRIKFVATGSGNVTASTTYVLGDKDYNPSAQEFLDN